MSDQPPPGPSDPFGQQPGWAAPGPPPAGPPPAVPPSGDAPGQPPGWGPPPPGWGAPPPGYPTPPPGYGAPPPGYGTPPAYGAPGYGYGAAMGPKPDSYLVPAILTTLFCCLPAGIAAIVFAAQVDNRYSQGDYQGAVESSRKAKQWMWISVGLGVVAIILWIVLIAVGESTSDPYYYD